MIRYLKNLFELQFPITTFSKSYRLRSKGDYLYFDGNPVLKRGDLYNTFHLSIEGLPETLCTFAVPEAMLKAPENFRNVYILDDKLNIWIPNKQIEYEVSTYNLETLGKNYMIVKGIPYYLPYFNNKDAQYPVIAKVHDVYFGIDWSQEKLNETYVI